MAKENKKKTKVKESNVVATQTHIRKEKTINPRGKIFEGIVTSKFPKRITIEFARLAYVRKYERYAKSRTKIHARLPESMEKEINIGDLVRVQECRPLSKIIHFVAVNKLKDASEITEGKK